MAVAIGDGIERPKPMHAILHDTTAARHEPMHAVLHDATIFHHVQFYHEPMHAVLLDATATRHEPMHAVLHEATVFRHGKLCHEPMHAVLHDATTFHHGQLCLTNIDDAAATMGLAASAVLDSDEDAVSTMPLWCHLTGYAAIHYVQRDGYGNPTYVLPATLCWCFILDRYHYDVTDNNNKITCHRM